MSTILFYLKEKIRKIITKIKNNKKVKSLLNKKFLWDWKKEEILFW